MLDQQQYLDLSAVDIARLVLRRELSAVEVARAALARLGEVEPVISAFRDLWPDAAIEAAARVDRRVAAGERPPLAGVPLGVKAWEHLDSPQPRRLRDAGCIPIGATAVPSPGTAWQTWGHTERGTTANP